MFPAMSGWVPGTRVALPWHARGIMRPADRGRPLPSHAGVAERLRRAVRDLATAAMATLGGFVLLEGAMPAEASRAAYATGSAAIAIGALSAGLRTGILATAMITAVVAFLYLVPVGALAVADAGDQIGLALFAVNGLIVSVICGRVRSAHARGRLDTPVIPTTPPRAARASTAGNRSRGLRGSGIMVVGAHMFERLSARELEVLGLLAGGRSNSEIADTLVVSMNTVKSHLKSIFGKLGVVSRTQAVVRAGELGLLAPHARLTSRPAA